LSAARERPAIWGIVNVTPDSFSDGGRYRDAGTAIAHGLRLAEHGADVLDVGGESTRPGAAPVAPDEERARVLPVLAGLVAAGVAADLSIDTRRADVAAAALEAGARIVNDVSGGADPAMFEVVARADAGLVLMHMRGRPETMQDDPAYEDVVAEVAAWLDARRRAAVAAGVPAERIWLDPGIGFGKTLEHNLALLQDLEALVRLGQPVLLGASRKSFLGRLTGRERPDERLAGSLACVVRAMAAGVHAVRVHDVRETRELLDVLARIR